MESPHATDIGPYRIVRPLGRGGMGIVYLAEHRQTAELVALKTVTSTTAGQLAGLRREIHALAQLSHPGVVRILDHGVASGTPWYAMELLEGMTLRQWMRSDARAETTSALDAASTQSTARTWTETIPTLDGTAPVEPIPSTLPPEAAAGEAPRRTLSTDYMRDVVTLAWRICGPLAYVHGAGIVHRDLKPDNIFLRTDGSPVLVDFGLVAGTGGGTSRERLEVGGETTGTAWYIAPEQVHGEIVDARADLYSLGCVLYELLTGRPPFTGDRPVQVLYKHVSTTPLPPSRLSDGIPGDLDALVMRLLGKAPADRPGYADGVATLLETLGATVADRAPATPYLYRPEMVGRDGAMGALSARLADLGRGRGSIALLRGESGAGKTRLAVQLGIVARREGHHVLSGECHDAPADAMLAPLQEPLVRIAAYCRDHGDAEHVLGGRRSSLAYVEPSILDLPAPPEPPLPRDLPPEALRRKLFADLTATLAALGSGPAGRTVLLLDDLQWADEATLAWLGTLVESIEGRPILVIGTHRAEEPRAELQKLADDPRVTTIPVERLGSADVGTMVREMLALESAADPIVEPLTAHSEGNPFYVAEYLRVAVAEGLLSRDALGHWRLASGAASISGLPLPRAIQDLVIRRIGLLSSAARSAANAAAILGRECATDVASAVSDLRGDDWLSALTELVARQVVEEVALGRIRFLHDKLREGTIAALDAAARRELHGRAAETLSAEGAGRAAEAAEVAAHWRDAGSHDAACGEFLRAARLALDAQLLALSERCYVEALALADVAMPEMVRARVELAERVLLALSRPEAARAEATTALHAARATGDRACEAHALRALGGAHRLQGARAEARDCLKRSLAIAESLGDGPCLSATLGTLAWLCIEEADNAGARAALDRALPLVRAAGNRRSEAILKGTLARILFNEGSHREACALWESAIAIAGGIGDRWMQAISLGNLANSRAELGDVLAALDLLERARRLHVEMGNRRGEAIALHGMAIVEADMGRISAARAHLEAALPLHEEAGNTAGVLGVREQLASLDAEEGRPDAAARALETLVAECRERGDRRQEQAALGNLAKARAALGLRDAAIAANDEAIAIARSIHHDLGLGIALMQRAALGASDAEAALGILRRLGNEHHEAVCLREMAVRARLDGRHDAALALLDEAAQLVGDGPDVVERVRLAIERALVLEARGLHAGASAAAAIAKDQAEPLCAEPSSETGRMLARLAAIAS